MHLFTVGHGTRAAEELLDVLRAHGVGTLCDVRAFPRSRRWPWFDGEALAAALGDGGLAYRWLGRALGGYRKSRRPDSPHTSLTGMWRAYADHMETAEFKAGVADLLAAARERPTAFLCAERDWRRCHRRHIADHLVALEGAEVLHLLDRTAPEAHRLDPRARVAGERLVYDVGAQGRLFP